MKLTAIFTAASLVVATAMPVFAQTAAPATPAPATPAPATAPTAYATVPVVKQVSTQLTAQGYSITGVTKSAAGVYTIAAVSATGAPRTITVNPATGSVTDTLAGGAGAAAGEAGEGPEGAEGAETEGRERGGHSEHGGSGERGSDSDD